MKDQTNQDNRRVRMTKRLLRESMMELLREKPPVRITIKELCDKADLNRSTFYAHYYDVQDLYLEMGNELVDALEEHVRVMRDRMEPSAQAMLTYIRDHGEMFRLLIYGPGLSDSAQPLRRRMYTRVEEILAPLAGDGPGQERGYFLEYMVCGGDGVIRRWVARDFDLEPAALSRLLERAMVSSMTCLAEADAGKNSP